MFKQIEYNGKLIALIITASYRKEGITFFTPNDLSQQLAYMQHTKGHVIAAHTHNAVPREVHYTKEVLVIRKGKLRADFYDDDRTYIKSIILSDGDIILLANGGHGFEVLEDVEMVEIKQGPYIDESDKTRFPSVDATEICYDRGETI